MADSTQSLNNLTLQVARRQKRLAFWKDQFLTLSGESDGHHSTPSVDRISASERSRMEEILKTYQLLLSRLVQAHLSKNSADSVDVENRLGGLDREMTTLFESRRLLTSTIGSAAISE